MRALTGKDTDRLPEEQRRGISIDLGYAPLELPDGRRLSLVDVPGHERFVRTMVAGATGIDLFLLVVDAGEGARPQTHEHLAILRLLGVEQGVVAVTKADAVDAETLELAVEEARELVPGAEVVAVSAKTGAGLDELRAALARAADGVERDGDRRPTRLYVDRSFTLRGIGTVVTGTLWSGTLGAGDELRLEPAGTRRARAKRPGARPRGRARGAGPARRREPAGCRAQRGRAAAMRSSLRARIPVSYRLDVALEELEPIRDGARVHGARGDRGALARVVGIGEQLGAARLASPVVAARGDRVDPPRRDHARRRRRSRSRPAAASRRRADGAPRARRDRGDRSMRPCTSTRSAIVLDGEPDGRRARRAVGLLPRLAATSWRASCERGSRRPTRSTRACRCRPSRGRATCCRCCPSSVAAPSSTLPGADAVARRARGGGRRAGARARRGRRAGDEGRRRRARPVPGGARVAGPARRRLCDRRRGYEGARRRRSSQSARPPGGSRSRASATRRRSGGATPSSCSSASTRTASRAASAMQRVLRKGPAQGKGEASLAPTSRP